MSMKKEADDHGDPSADAPLLPPHAGAKASRKALPPLSFAAVKTRPQTLEEQRQTDSVLHLFLAELIRQTLQDQKTSI